MKEELGKIHFKKMVVADHYDPKHRIHSFYMKKQNKAYEHKSLGEEELFMNVTSEKEMKKVHAKLQEEA